MKVGEVLAQLSDRERSELVTTTSEMHLEALVEGASDETALALVAGHLAGTAYRVVLDDVHEAECHCDSFSDCYKSVTGVRPRGYRWTCNEVGRWFAENYRETVHGHFEPVVPFDD